MMKSPTLKEILVTPCPDLAIVKVVQSSSVDSLANHLKFPSFDAKSQAQFRTLEPNVI